MRIASTLFLLLIVGLLVAPSLGSAAPVIFFGEDLGLGENTPLAAHPNADLARTMFFNNLVGVGTETFESYSNGTGAPLAVSFGSAGTATLHGDGNIAVVTPGSTNGYGRYAISGSHYWESQSQFSIDFSAPVAAFGFYGVDVGDFNGQLTLGLVGGSSVTLTVPNTMNGPGGSVLYYGFYDTVHQYTSATFGNTAPGVDVFAFDNMSIGSLQQVKPTPEPGTLMLLGAGLAGLVRIRRKNRA